MLLDVSFEAMMIPDALDDILCLSVSSEMLEDPSLDMNLSSLITPEVVEQTEFDSGLITATGVLEESDTDLTSLIEVELFDVSIVDCFFVLSDSNTCCCTQDALL